MTENAATGAHRLFALVRALADAPAQGARVTHLARQTGLTPATAHRLLQALVAEGMVEQDTRNKHYRLGIELFCLAARSGHAGSFIQQCRPVLLRLCASLGDTVFLMVRSGFDAVCVDRAEGPFPIRSFSRDIGGRVALGVGQAAMSILAFQPAAEREEIIRFNLSRLREYGVYDEVYLRTEIDRVRAQGFAARNTGLLEGMAGVAVPIIDGAGNAVAALSVGSLADRLRPDRLPTVVELLKREATQVGAAVNPFDVALRFPLRGQQPPAASEPPQLG
ncbi:IclR family transcriptional regulator [Ottowia testudinis]|uniref:IclR family transcriptional regulator n=1 Tax=Ottowia testudinis TaxID=2816950 RepID=A0A975H3W6_9BURK|nr:IclR family transcriptional regulator [Ottowia testudinis]QTD45691.1 IclR family transcriptional regulator [Ottowia testudinis]